MIELPVVSGDSHLEVPPTDWLAYVPDHFREFAPQVVVEDGNEAVQVPGNYPIYNGTNLGTSRPIVMRGASYWDADGNPSPGTGGPSQRLLEQDQDGISAEVLYAPLFMGRCLEGVEDKDAYRSMVSAYNTFLTDYCSHSPERLIGVGVIPNTGIDDAMQELRHIADLGLKAVCPRWFPNGVGMPSPDDDKFWAETLNLGIRVSPHSSFGGPPNRMQRIVPGLVHAPEPPTAFGLAARTTSGIPLVLTQLIADGVFDRFPDLTLYLAEVNAGWLPNALSMLDDSYSLLKDCYDIEFKMSPSEYILEHCLFGIVRDPVALEMVTHGMIPAKNIAWGSDFPHAVTSWPDSQAWLAKATLTDADRQMVTRTNVLDFLGVNRAGT